MSYYYVNTHEAYAWIENALRYCTIEKQLVKGDDRENPILFVNCNGKMHELSYKDVFVNDYLYERNEPVTLSKVTGFHLNMKVDSQDGGFRFSYVDGGRVIESRFENDIEITFNGDSWDFMPQDIPSEYYPHKEVAQGMIHYTAVDSDGNFIERKGAIQRIMLTEEQKKLVVNFIKAYNKAKEAGVFFIYDRDCEKLYAVNDKEDKVETMDNCDADDSVEIAMVEYIKDFRVSISLGYMTDDCQVYVKK